MKQRTREWREWTRIESGWERVFEISWCGEVPLLAVEGDEAAHGDGALGDEALDIVRGGAIPAGGVESGGDISLGQWGVVTNSGDFLGGFGIEGRNGDEHPEGEVGCRWVRRPSAVRGKRASSVCGNLVRKRGLISVVAKFQANAVINDGVILAAG